LIPAHLPLFTNPPPPHPRHCARRSRKPLSSSPIVEGPGTCRETSCSAFRTNDDEDFALPAPCDANSVFGALDSIHVGPLQGGLDNLLRNQGWCRRWAVHLKLPPAHSRLHRARLHTLDKFCLAHPPPH